MFKEDGNVLHFGAPRGKFDQSWERKKEGEGWVVIQ